MINSIYLISRFKQSGPVNQALNIVSGMDKNRCNMVVVTMSPDFVKNRKDKFDAAGIKYIQLNRRGWDLLGCVRDLKKIIEDNKIDVVHSSGVRPDLCNLLLPSKILKVTTIRSEIANVAERNNLIIKYIVQRIQSNSLKKLDVAVACSNALANKILNETGRKVDAIHNCVDTDYFCPAADKMLIREELGLPPDKRIFVVLGSLIERKNNDIVLDYFNTKTTDDFLLLMIGDGKLKEGYQQKYAHSNIKYLGHIEQPLKYLQASDFLISASVSEGLPNTVLESLACGIPVILSDIEPHREILEEGNVGIIFDYYSKASLENALNELCQRDYMTLSKNCRTTAVHCFGKLETAKKYCQMYYDNLKK